MTFKQKNAKMIGIELFSGAGGMGLGAALAGVDIKLAIEADPHAAYTYAHNHPNVKILVDKIENFTEIPTYKTKKPRILFGGPPCQGFSTSNQRTRTVNNPQNWLHMEFVRIARAWKPDWVVMENVKGVIETERGCFLNSMTDNLRKSGYVVTWWVLNAVEFGVPQRRYRLFIIGSLHGLCIEKPEPKDEKPVTVREAIVDLPDLPNGASHDLMPYKLKPISEYARKMRGGLKKCRNHIVTRNSPCIIKRYRHVPQGGNWTNIPISLMENYADRHNCHTGIYYRLRNDQPSIVIGNYRKNMLIHPEQDRGLSVREAARLQSFPDWYEFKGSIGFQQQQVGNAVPPLLAKSVFDAIIRKI